MPHSEIYNDCQGYWLNSSVDNSSNYIYRVYYMGFIGGASNNTNTFGVCPVVSLPSDLQVTNNNSVWSLAN